MAVFVDLRCSRCNLLIPDQWSTREGERHADCRRKSKGVLERVYTLTPAPSPGGHHTENSVVYISEKEGGRIQYPGRADVPVPPRLVARGYEKVVITPREMGAFERKTGRINERRHWDRNGNGI